MKRMYSTVLSVLMIAFALMASGCSWEKVPAGNVGVKVYNLGSDKGDIEIVGVGRQFLGINTDLYLFPTFTQNYTWTKARDVDESISFQTVEGMSVNGDFGISYSIDPDKIESIFKKYRKGVDEITDVFLRNMVRDSLNRRGAVLTVESVYGKGKSDLIDAVQKDVSEQVKEVGINIEKFYLVGELRLPPTVLAALNKKVESTQMAQQRENEIAQSKAEAEKEIASARGKAESMLAVAKAEAESMRVKGEALRSNPELIQLQAIERWNGVMPVIQGSGAVPIIDSKMLLQGASKE